jgi:hypothetical protein
VVCKKKVFFKISKYFDTSIKLFELNLRKTISLEGLTFQKANKRSKLKYILVDSIQFTIEVGPEELLIIFGLSV